MVTINVTSCLAITQLVAGWLLLALATLCLALVPGYAEFLGLSSNHREYDSSRNLTVFGLWVVAEIIIFLLLLGMTSVLMCACQNVPRGAGMMHLLVDPVLVTLACVPFLRIKGLPTANYRHICLVASENKLLNVTGHLLLEGQPDYQKCHAGHQAAWNTTDSISTKKLQLEHWVTGLQCIVFSPVFLRLLHYRWKMGWQAFFHSTFYLTIQAVDVSTLVIICSTLISYNVRLTCETTIYISTLFLSISCLSLATPPVYYGADVTDQYLRVLLFAGTLALDTPALMLKACLLFRHEEQLLSYDAMFCVTLVKNVTSVLALIGYIVANMECVRTQYASIQEAPLITRTNVDQVEHDEEDFV